MTEENKGLENSEVVRRLVTPNSLQSVEESGDRSPTKTERDISSEPQEIAESSNPNQPDKVRRLVTSTTEEDLTSLTDDRSATEKDQ